MTALLRAFPLWLRAPHLRDLLLTARQRRALRREREKAVKWDVYSVVAWAERTVDDPWFCYRCAQYVAPRNCWVTAGDYLEHKTCGGGMVERDPFAGKVLQ